MKSLIAILCLISCMSYAQQAVYNQTAIKTVYTLDQPALGEQIYVKPVVIPTQKVASTNTYSSVYVVEQTKQKTNFTATYSPAYVIQYNLETDEQEAEFAVTGKCIYTMSYSKSTTVDSKVLFTQYDLDGTVTKTSKYIIVKVTEDDTAYDCLVSDGVGYMSIIFWKDHSMVVIENDSTRVFIMQDKK